jgi:hypothetical protein
MKTKKNRINVEKRLETLESRVGTKHIDFKFTDQSAALTPATTGTIYYMSAVSQDDTRSGRTGERITVEYIEWRWNIIATLTSNYRMVIFRDMFNQQVAPAVSDVLQTASVSSSYSYANYVNNKRFKILFDRCTSQSAVGDLSNTGSMRIPCRFINLFNGTGSTVASAAQGVIFLLVITDTAASGTLNTYYRMVFSDP